MPVTGAGVIDVIDNDFDPDEDRLTLVSATDPPHGTADCAAIGSCRYVPDDGYTGSDSFAYTVRDPDGLEGSATVLVEVTAPPALRTVVARGDRASTRQDEAVTVAVLANDDGEDLELTGTPEAQHGEVSCEPDGDVPLRARRRLRRLGRLPLHRRRRGRPQRRGGRADRGRRRRHGLRAVARQAGPARRHAGPATRAGRSAVRPTPADADDEALAALAPPAVTAELTGAQQADAASVRTARGWTADPPADGGRVLHARAGAGALLGAASETFARPLPPINQGLGGDGHVAILMGSKVYRVLPPRPPDVGHLPGPGDGSRLPRLSRPADVRHELAAPGPGGRRGHAHLHPSHAAGDIRLPAPGDQPLLLGHRDDPPVRLTIVDRMPGRADPGRLAGRARGRQAPLRLRHRQALLRRPGDERAVRDALGADRAREELGPDYDIVAHGTRVYVSRNNGRSRASTSRRAHGAPAGRSRRTSARAGTSSTASTPPGKAVGICVIDGRAGDCLLDAAPASVTPITGWPSLENYWGNVQEAETGTRTFVGGFPYAGMGCWDWTTMAPCTGHGYDQDGWLTTDIDGNPLPSAYGGVWDGACVVALGDPGLVFTLDPSAGVSPCAGLQGTRRTVDLRDQRCDGTVGAARWKQVLLADAAPGELASVTVTVRDAATGAALATKDLTGGALDLSGIDAVAHPAVTIEANTASTAGDPAWDDAIPPRIRLTWQPDPKQLCFEATTAPECEQPLAPLGLKAGLDGQAGKLEEQVPLLRARARRYSPPSPTARSTRRRRSRSPWRGATRTVACSATRCSKARRARGSTPRRERSPGRRARRRARRRTPSPCGSAIQAACTASARSG